MYLKSLELIGFKSFADRTKLEFEPGMTAIVGPNGCGKSNVADALRWVLGEQSAKAMRGSKMEDVIFNGTDTHKPMGMAEVSLTLADCEKVLGLEYNEVTITRRVFRSGEGQYFINKAPCRLKDIQRLFMDTGIGTNAYSLMEQGRIDKILSSHPEDRRAVFEEASGITKFKADKKEAIRKLDQTEANLLRLADIIREVKRQIISLQRQAGKARRYQALMEQLRSYDLYASREKLTQFNQSVSSLESRIASIVEQDEAVRQDIEVSEQQTAEVRAELTAEEHRIAELMESAVRARTELERVRELIHTNEDRIQELKVLSERDSRDAEEAKLRLEQHAISLRETEQQHETACSQRDASERDLSTAITANSAAETALEEAVRALNRYRTEQLDAENRASQAQNELTALDAQERSNMIRRERLAAEQQEMQRSLEVFEGRKAEVTERIQALTIAANEAAEQLKLLQLNRADKAQALTTLKSSVSQFQQQMAAKQAQIDMLQMSRAQREGFPEGARMILDENSDLRFDRSLVIGPIAELLRAEPAYHLALEAALRPWLDAIVLRDDAAAIAVLAQLEQAAAGSARVLVAGVGAGPEALDYAGHDPLLNHVHCSDDVKPLLQRLLRGVVVAENTYALPTGVPAAWTVVTKTGAVLKPGEYAEFWKRENEQSNPLARQQLLADWQDQLGELQRQLATVEENIARLIHEESTVADAIEAARVTLDDSRRQLANAEGESRVVLQEARQAAERVETVAYELQSLSEQHSETDEHRLSISARIEQYRQKHAELREQIAQGTELQREREEVRSRALVDVSDRRIAFSEVRQRAETLAAKRDQLVSRIDELTAVVEERSRGISTYQQRMADLQRGVAEATLRIDPLDAESNALRARIDEARQSRETRTARLSELEAFLRTKRAALDEIRTRRSQNDIELAEQKMRRQNLLERVTGDYKVDVTAIDQAAEPAWENGEKLEGDALDTIVEELRAKIEGMGPVNLVAIEEHRELEERETFLTTQQNDLVASKDQLMELIREINKTTTEMFAKTFEAVNQNFQVMFTQLFGGGTAKLVLLDDGDVLESGIEIIARPPGKKLQTVSLMSGGERTMTAVALLFSLYLVKPSPFCMLDELDAALDEANIGRFVTTVQSFLDKSQFVVITHNRKTIAAARMLYGVTMEQHGVSKIVSVKFNETSEDPRAAADREAAAAASEEAVTSAT